MFKNDKSQVSYLRVLRTCNAINPFPTFAQPEIYQKTPILLAAGGYQGRSVFNENAHVRI